MGIKPPAQMACYCNGKNISMKFTESIYFLSAEFKIKLLSSCVQHKKGKTCCNHPFIIWQNISSIINHKTCQYNFFFMLLFILVLILNTLLYPEPDIKWSKNYQDRKIIGYQINNATLNV